MKTKIVMMTALLALLATGCGKNNGDGRIRIFAENMTAVGNGSKLLIDTDNPASSSQWLLGEEINVNDVSFTIGDDGNGNYQLDVTTLGEQTLFAVYPGDEFGGNSWHVDNSDSDRPIINLANLVLNFHDGTTTHDVVFPMGAKAEANAGTMMFRHLTAGFRLTLQATSSVTLTNLKVIVYGDAPSDVEIDGVRYTVQWAGLTPSVPVGPTGSITDRVVANASEMNFTLKTDGSDGVTFSNKQICIPVVAQDNVKRITVIGYNGSSQVFAKTSTLAGEGVDLEINKIYPVKAIQMD